MRSEDEHLVSAVHLLAITIFAMPQVAIVAISFAVTISFAVMTIRFRLSTLGFRIMIIRVENLSLPPAIIII